MSKNSSFMREHLQKKSVQFRNQIAGQDQKRLLPKRKTKKNLPWRKRNKNLTRKPKRKLLNLKIDFIRFKVIEI